MKPLYLSIFVVLMGATGALAADAPAEHPAAPPLTGHVQAKAEPIHGAIFRPVITPAAPR